MTAAREALETFGADSARVVVGRNPNMWWFRITPRRETAAKVECFYGGDDEITLHFGTTHVYLWDDDANRLASEVRRYLDAIFAGRIEEAGSTRDGFARLWSANGDAWSAGNVHLPLPWRLRRRRRYDAYN